MAGHAYAVCPLVLAHPQCRPVIPNVLRRAQYLLAYPGGCEFHDTTQSALVGGHQEAGQCSLKRAGGLDGAQGLDGADKGAALEYDAVGEFGDGHLKIPAIRFGSGGGVGDRPSDHDLACLFLWYINNRWIAFTENENSCDSPRVHHTTNAHSFVLPFAKD